MRSKLNGALAGALSAALAASAGAADAGAPRGNEPPESAGTLAAKAPGTELRSRFFPKHINPGMLSEKVRARLEESARTRAIEAGRNGTAAPGERSFPALAEPSEGVIERVDPPANGAALRRMVSFENDEGVTVLSNRPKDVPAPAPAARAPFESEAAEPAPAPAQRETTQTRRLRPKPPEARSARGPEPRSTWPWFALGGTALAGVGVWWIRRGRPVSGRD